MNKSIFFTLFITFGGNLLFAEKDIPKGKPQKLDFRVQEFSNEEKPRPKFPLRWGKPPLRQVKDLVELPGNFGKGSSTLASWIKENLNKDIEKKNAEIRRPEKPEISEEIKTQIESVRELEKAIHSEIKARVEALGKEATREEIKATVEAFKESNKDRFEEIKEAHSAIKEDMIANRPEKPERPELTEELKVKVDALHSARKEMHEAQKELRETLKDASEEERKEAITAFKEANKAKHEEIKSQAKEVKEEIRALVETEATRTSDL
jgi:DNA repair exonuclease SbcCD ATPase subunit